MTERKYKISVIIPVLNEAAKIESCLEAVFGQSLKPCEVIVVDGHSTDETVAEASKFPVTILYQDHGACGAARQIGLGHAQGEYVAFTDADCIPSKDWLQNLVSAFKEGIIGVGGSIKNIGESFWIRSTNFVQDSFIGGGTSISRLFKNKRFVKSISACNSMYRKMDLVDIGGFNTNLSGADETELNRRLSRKGKLLYVPNAMILHDHDRGLKEFAINIFHYGRWRRECGVWDLPCIPPLAVPFILLTLIFTRWVLIALFVLYLVAIVIQGFRFALKQRDIRYLFSIPFVYIIEHLFYTVGFWYEALHLGKLRRKCRAECK